VSATRSRGRKAFRSAGVTGAGSSVQAKARTEPNEARPDWKAVEELIYALAGSHAVFPTANSSSNWISAYEPGRRLMVESGRQSSWVQVDHIRACWEKFEERGRVCRQDVLEPGRRSAFMMALFEQVPGVGREKRDGRYLVFARSSNDR
jgi:hypothetical protein